MIRRRILASKNTLPSTYQQVEYINSVTKSYINLGTKTWTEPGFIADFLITSRNNQYGPHIISSFPNNFLWLVGRSYNNSTLIAYLGKQTGGFTPNFPLNKRCVVSFNTNRNLEFHAKWDSGESNGIATTDNSVSSATMYLFAYANEPTNNYYHLVGKCFGIQIYNAGILIENYVPCYKKSDNKVGLYETINGIFYPSIGTADFTAGPEI